MNASLWSCPVCGREISANAVICPACGEPLVSARVQAGRLIRGVASWVIHFALNVIGVTALLLVILVMLGTCVPEAP